MDPSSQESRPDTPDSSTVHGSPAESGWTSIGTHFAEFQALPPPSAQALHFSPAPQSCSNREHSGSAPPPSGSVMTETPTVSSVAVVLLDPAGSGSVVEFVESVVVVLPAGVGSSDHRIIGSSDHRIIGSSDHRWSSPTRRVVSSRRRRQAADMGPDVSSRLLSANANVLVPRFGAARRKPRTTFHGAGHSGVDVSQTGRQQRPMPSGHIVLGSGGRRRAPGCRHG